jgi:hypothetical protein
MGVVAGLLGVVHALASTAQRQCGAATNSMRRAGRSATFEPGLLKRVKNFSFRGCIRRSTVDPPGPTVPPVRGTLSLREDVVRPQRTIRGEGKEGTHSLPLSAYTEPGGLRQDPGRAAQSPAEARTCGNGDSEMRVLLSTYTAGAWL